MINAANINEMSSNIDCIALKRTKCGSLVFLTTSKNSMKKTINGITLFE